MAMPSSAEASFKYSLIPFFLFLFLSSSCSTGHSAPDAGLDSGDTELDFSIDPEVPFSDCEVEWDYFFEMPNVDSSVLNSVLIGEDGYYAVGGASVNSDAGLESDDQGLLVRFSVDGIMNWYKFFGGSSYDRFSCGLFLNNGILVSGISREPGYRVCWLLFLTNNGEVVWSQMIDNGHAQSCGDCTILNDESALFSGNEYERVFIGFATSADLQDVVYDDYPFDISVNGISYLPDGETVTVGSVIPEGGEDTPVFFNPITWIYNEDGILIKDIVFDRAYSASFIDSVISGDDMVVAGGSSDLVPGAFLIKFDGEGNGIWERHLGFSGATNTHSIISSEHSYFIATASNSYSGYIAEIDELGHIIWNTEIPVLGDSAYHDIGIEDAGGIVLVGWGDKDAEGYNIARATRIAGSDTCF
jgi:hypothetical protein